MKSRKKSKKWKKVSKKVRKEEKMKIKCSVDIKKLTYMGDINDNDEDNDNGTNKYIDNINYN